MKYVSGFAATSGGAISACFSDEGLRKPSWFDHAPRKRLHEEDAPGSRARRRAPRTHEQIESDVRNFI